MTQNQGEVAKLLTCNMGGRKCQHNMTRICYWVERVTRVKHPETGRWILSVVYWNEERSYDYARELNDFLNKFEMLSTAKRGEEG